MASNLPGSEDIALDPDLLKTLASDSRREILRLLKTRRMTLTELATAQGLGKATVLEHLKKLQDANLIVRREDERLWIYYELTPRGRRVVTPGKTRFFLVMAFTAAGALLLGVILTLALTHQDASPHPETAPAFDGVAPVRADGDLVAWSHLSDGAHLALSQGGRPVRGSVFIDDGPYAVDADGILGLSDAQLDAISIGNHTLGFLPENGSAREPVAGWFDVRDPQPALVPLQLVAGRENAITLAFADAQAPVPRSVLVHGEAVAVQPREGGLAEIRITPTGTQPISVQVGRTSATALEVLPDLRVSFAKTPSGANVHVANSSGAPIDGVAVFLGNASLGETDPAGNLSVPDTADGSYVLGLVGGGGDISLAVRSTNGTLSEEPPRVHLEAAGNGISALVRNDGVAPIRLTMVTLVDGRFAASAPLTVRGNDSAMVSLPLRISDPGSHEAVLEARSLEAVPGGVLGNATGGPSPEGAPGRGLAGTVLARLTLAPVYGLTTPTYSPGFATPAPKVPAPPWVLVVVAAAALAMLRRRR